MAHGYDEITLADLPAADPWLWPGPETNGYIPVEEDDINSYALAELSGLIGDPEDGVDGGLTLGPAAQRELKEAMNNSPANYGADIDTGIDSASLDAYGALDYGADIDTGIDSASLDAYGALDYGAMDYEDYDPALDSDGNFDMDPEADTTPEGEVHDVRAQMADEDFVTPEEAYGATAWGLEEGGYITTALFDFGLITRTEAGVRPTVRGTVVAFVAAAIIGFAMTSSSD